MSEQSQLPLTAAAGALASAAAYVRMSTDHQQYSTHNQLDRIKEYAAQRGMNIVRVFADEGKSGLSIRGRECLTQMMSEVEAGKAEFTAILVYDVSRWGRFQDADESAYYEYICRRAGISVHYCAEQFTNDGSPTSNIIKSVKRSMAGEYSRELSTKVFAGACRLITLGYKQGGAAGYGLRRVLIDQAGKQKGVLSIGEHKSLQTDRVILQPGPEAEQELVRWIYRTFLEGRTEREIADSLNARQIATDLGRTWTRGIVHQIRSNEKYCGHNVYNRTSFKLKRKHLVNPREMWVRADNVFPAIVDADTFARVQAAIIERCRRFTDDEMLSALRDLWTRHGRISGLLIDEQDAMPSSAAFRYRFGSLIRAYQLVGYTPETDYSFLAVNRFLRARYPELVQDVITRLNGIGVTVARDPKTELLTLDNELTVSLVLSRCLRTTAGASRWMLRFEESLRPDLTIAARMNEANDSIRDYYLFPAIDLAETRLRLREDNHLLLDAYRFDDLQFFFEMTERIAVEAAA